MSTVDPNDYPCTARRRPLREGDGSAPPMPWEELRFASERVAMEDIEHPAEPLRGAWLYRVTFPVARSAEDFEANPPSLSRWRSRVYVVRTDSVRELTLQQGDVVALSADVDFVDVWEHVEDPAMLFRVACNVGYGTQLAAAAGIAGAMLGLARRMVNVRDQQTARSEAGWCQGGGSRSVLEVLDVWTRSRATLAPLLDGLAVEAYFCAAIREAVTIDAVALELERQALAREKAAEMLAERMRGAASEYVGLPNSAENRAALTRMLRRELADFDAARGGASLWERQYMGEFRPNDPAAVPRDALDVASGATLDAFAAQIGMSREGHSDAELREVLMRVRASADTFANRRDTALLTLSNVRAMARALRDPRDSDAADALALALEATRDRGRP